MTQRFSRLNALQGSHNVHHSSHHSFLWLLYCGGGFLSLSFSQSEATRPYGSPGGAIIEKHSGFLSWQARRYFSKVRSPAMILMGPGRLGRSLWLSASLILTVRIFASLLEGASVDVAWGRLRGLSGPPRGALGGSLKDPNHRLAARRHSFKVCPNDLDRRGSYSP